MEGKKEFQEYLDDWIKSDRGKAYADVLRSQNELKVKRWTRFETWLENNDFDKLMYRIIYEHNDEYREKCYINGFQPFPNMKLKFILDYVVRHHEPIEVSKIDCPFPNTIYLFKGYYFQIIYGQGSFIRIYNCDDNRILLQL